MNKVKGFESVKRENLLCLSGLVACFLQRMSRIRIRKVAFRTNILFSAKKKKKNVAATCKFSQNYFKKNMYIHLNMLYIFQKYILCFFYFYESIRNVSFSCGGKIHIVI